MSKFFIIKYCVGVLYSATYIFRLPSNQVDIKHLSIPGFEPKFSWIHQLSRNNLTKSKILNILTRTRSTRSPTTESSVDGQRRRERRLRIRPRTSDQRIGPLRAGRPAKTEGRISQPRQSVQRCTTKQRWFDFFQ